MKNLYLMIFTFVVLVGLQSCTKNDANTSNVQLKLVDAPGDYANVNVVINDIQYNRDGTTDGWVSFKNNYPIKVDLTKLIAGNSLVLSDVIMPKGMLKQIRLVLGDGNTLTIDGISGEIPLSTPSAQQSGLKLNLNTVLEAGFSYTFILDWDVQKSIVKAGNSNTYILKPVIRVNTEVNSGSIKGKVESASDMTALQDASIKVYTATDVYVGETSTDANGNFILQGLSSGNYKLEIEHDGYQSFEKTETVTVGNVTDSGTIQLTAVTA